jgi:hypothetical protein
MTETTVSLSDQLLEAFINKVANDNDRIKFQPELKVKRDNDTLYISEIRKTKLGSLLVTVEVYTTRKSDKAPMPVAVLDEKSQKLILSKLLS